MRDLLVFCLVFGSLPFILWRPYIGVLVWSWLAFMNPHRLTWGFAFDFPFSAVVAAVLICSVALSREPKRIPWTSVTAVWLLFFGWTYFTTVFAMFPHGAEGEWERWWKVNLISAVTLMVINSRHRLHLLVWVIVLSLGFFGVKGGLFSLRTDANFMVFGPPFSFIADNTSLALALIMTLPLIRYLQLQTNNRWVQLGLLMSMGLSILAILSSFSRGALLGIIAMAVVIVFKSPNRLKVLVAVLVISPFLWTFMPEAWHEKMGTIKTYQEDGSAMGRINAWWFAYNLAKDRPIGGGFRVFHPQYFEKYAPDPEDFHDAHSIYFEVLGEQGFVGLALFLLLGSLSLYTGTWIIRNSRDRPDLEWARDLAAMLQVSLIGYAVCGAFLGLAYFDLYYTLVAMMVLTRSVVEQEVSQRLPSTTPSLRAGKSTPAFASRRAS